MDAEHGHLRELLTAAKELVESKERALYAAIQSVKEAADFALQAAERATLKSDAATEKRFDGVNEFRAALGDQQRTLMPRSEVDVIFRGLTKQLEDQNTLIAAQNVRLVAISAEVSGKKEGLQNGWGFAVGAVGIFLAILSIASFFLRHGA